MRYLTIIFLFLATFATGQQALFLRSTPAPSGTTGILDSYTGAEVAYATALLYSSYGGSCLRVRRDSDDAEQDIGFSGQDIDEAAINSFCSGANCFVKTWYDQSGNGNDATQATAGNQPKIYDSSTGIVYESSAAALNFDGANDRLFFTSAFPGAVSDFSIFFVENTIQNSGYTITSTATAAGFTELLVNRHGYTDYFQTAPVGSGFSPTTYILASLILVAPSGNTYQNGVFRTNGGYSQASFKNTGAIGGWFYSFKNGEIQVVVIYASDQSANRTGIESVINNYFNIF